MKQRCEQCKSTFDAGSKKRRFCSNACKFDAWRNQVLKKCDVCGNEFSVARYRATARFCSRKCRVHGLTISVTQEVRRRALAENVAKSKSDECWPWQGSVTRAGYGLLRIGRRFQEYAHRVSFEEFVCAIPEGRMVCHTCDNPPCCNPAHLFIGTSSDNQKDMVAKDRQSRGERRYNKKITDRDVRAIRSSRLSQAKLAETYSVHPSVVSRVISRKSWRHVR